MNFTKSLKMKVREFVLRNEGLFEVRLELYAIMWEFLYKDRASQEQELARLLEDDSVDAAFFAAYFNLMKGDEETLATIAARAGGEHVGHWLPLADLAAEMEDTGSLVRHHGYDLPPYRRIFRTNSRFQTTGIISSGKSTVCLKKQIFRKIGVKNCS